MKTIEIIIERYAINKHMVRTYKTDVKKYITLVNKAKTSVLDRKEYLFIADLLKRAVLDGLCYDFMCSPYAADNLRGVLKVIYREYSRISVEGFLNQDTEQFLRRYNFSTNNLVSFGNIILNVLNQLYGVNKSSFDRIKYKYIKVLPKENLSFEEELVESYRDGLRKCWLSEDFVIKNWSEPIVSRIIKDYEKFNLSVDEIFKVIYGKDKSPQSFIKIGACK